MEFKIKTGFTANQKVSCAVVAVFDNKKLSPSAEMFDKASKGSIRQLFKKGDLTGKKHQTLLLYNITPTCERLLLIGCGSPDSITAKDFYTLMITAFKTLTSLNITEATLLLAEISLANQDFYWRVKQAVLAAAETQYHYDRFKSQKNPPIKKQRITVIAADKKELSNGKLAITEGKALATSTAFVKDLVMTPGNVCTPSYLAEEAQRLAKNNKKISTTILEEKDMKKLGMDALLAVSAGSPQPAKFIIIKYQPTPKTKTPPVVFVGKGITFDTGGHSLKPADSMINMKYDMAGGATALGILKFAALMELSFPVTAVIASAENIPGGHACRPDDVVTTLAGLTVEIANTDAEGRLVLCDALAYVTRFKPRVVIDIATLTGACVVALGNQACALYSNDETVAADLLAASQADALDRCWRMPLWPEYQKQLESPVADLCNIGGAGAGSITAACFLANFTQEYPWAHLDVAGVAGMPGTQGPSDKKNATGRPLRLLAHYLMTLQGTR